MIHSCRKTTTAQTFLSILLILVSLLLSKSVCPMHRETKQTKMSVWSRERFIGGSGKENGQLRLRKARTPNGLGERVFIGKIWGGAAVCVTFLWLVGGEVTKKLFQEFQSSAFWFQPVWGPVLSLKLSPSTRVGALVPRELTDRYVSNCYAHLSRKKDSVPLLCYGLFLHALTPPN